MYITVCSRMTMSTRRRVARLNYFACLAAPLLLIACELEPEEIDFSPYSNASAAGTGDTGDNSDGDDTGGDDDGSEGDSGLKCRR